MEQKKGFRKNKQLTRSQLSEVSDKTQSQLEVLSNTVKFLTQQTMQQVNIANAIRSEITALANLLRCDNSNEAIKKGDKVLIDFSGVLLNEDGSEGDTFEGASMIGSLIEIGSGNFVAGFEDALMNHKTGEIVNVNVTFPENYHVEALQNKKALFNTKIIKVYSSSDNLEIEELHKKRLEALKSKQEVKEEVKEGVEA